MTAGYRCVLVGVDGSETAAVAAARAVELAVEWEAALHIVDVVPVPTVGVAVGDTAAAAIVARLAAGDERASAALAEVRRMAAEHGLAAIGHLVHGEPAPSILSAALHVGADLIVVGNRGLDAAGRHVVGSVPEAVLHGAHCDVLLVHTTP